MKHLLSSLTVWCVIGVSASSQETLPKDHAERMTRSAALFKNQVRGVLVKNCLKCHGGETTEGELEISDREKLLKGGDHGPAVVPGNAKKSLLFRLVSHEKKPVMPAKAAKLSASEIAAIAEWIDLGAAYDAPLIQGNDASAWQHRKIAADSLRHWSFQPLKMPAIPSVNGNGPIREIDRFLVAPIQQRGLVVAPRADRRVLIRRAYFDLIGLPPTPEQIRAFEVDRSPEAFEKVIDQLLASRHYGERWARHWLDLVRFAESHGFEHDYDRPSAYHYRDFVIKALNDGMPFDRFVKWQIAGDEMAPRDPSALMATGYLAAGVHSTQITKNEVEKHRYDELDDILATTGTAVLGLTIGCARCHDHKYDAIPQGDYYRMLSYFTSVVRHEKEIEFDGPTYLAAKQKYEAEHRPFVEKIEAYDRTELPKRFAEWDRRRPAAKSDPAWLFPKIISTKSAGGATITPQPDQSLVIGGKNPKVEELTITVSTGLQRITAIRLEALADPSLVKKGPGRAANGNFCLTDFRVAVVEGNGKARQVKLKNPRATFNQKGLSIETAIDSDRDSTGWAIDPQFGINHIGSFEFDPPLTIEKPTSGDASKTGNAPATTLTITLRFHNNVGHGMGRPRIALTGSDKSLPFTAESADEGLIQSLAVAPDRRTPAQTEVLLNRFKAQDPERVRLVQAERQHASAEPKRNLMKVLISTEGEKAVRLHTQGEDVLPHTHYLRRGDPNQKESVAEPGFLQVFNRGTAVPAPAPSKENPKALPDSKFSYRRTAFAERLMDPLNGSGALAARVIVNRLWHHHFGRGLVATTSDFGVRGAVPTHPELLEYLAVRMVQGGWSMKAMHREIMLSDAYARSSAAPVETVQADRDNRLWARRTVRRLEAETVRDALLSVSGRLEDRMFGPGTLEESSRRRSIYFTVKRSRLIPMMVVFDAPDGTVGIGERPSTTIAPQALTLMNNPHVRDWAAEFARRMRRETPEASVEAGYRMALGRPPSAVELRDAVAFLAEQRTATGKKTDADEAALRDLAQVILCLNEFIYVE